MYDRDDDSTVGNKRKRGSEEYAARLPPSYTHTNNNNANSNLSKVNSIPLMTNNTHQTVAPSRSEVNAVTPTFSSHKAQSTVVAAPVVSSGSHTIPNDYINAEIDHAAKASYARTSDDPKAALKSIHEVNAFVAIPVHDIRRQFALMFAEAIGSNDGDLLAKILQTHCTEDAVLIFKYKGKTSPYGPTFLEVIGKHAIVVFWPQGIATVPDMVFELLSTNIKVLSNGYCSITTKCKLTGTKVLELAVDSKESVVLVSDPTQHDNSSGKSSHSTGDGVLAIAIESESNPQVIPNQVPDDTLLKKVHKTGIKMNMITTITYYVDPNKQIYRIEFIHAMQHEKVNKPQQQH